MQSQPQVRELRQILRCMEFPVFVASAVRTITYSITFALDKLLPEPSNIISIKEKVLVKRLSVSFVQPILRDLGLGYKPIILEAIQKFLGAQ